MKKLLLILLFINKMFAFNVTYGGLSNPQKPVFCGREGHLYDISEPDMWEEIVKKSKEVNETYFYNLLRKALNKAFTVDYDLPVCGSLQIVKFQPVYTLQRDIYANGALLYKKGYRFNVLERLNKLMPSQKPIIIFGSLDNNLSKKIGLSLIKKYKNAIFAVTKGNIKKLAYEYPYKVAKANKVLLDKFNVKCDTTISVLGKRYVYNIQIPVNKLKKEEFEYILKKIHEMYKKYYRGRK
ncbi:hypothetical protein [Caminibacter sp.]